MSTPIAKGGMRRGTIHTPRAAEQRAALALLPASAGGGGSVCSHASPWEAGAALAQWGAAATEQLDVAGRPGPTARALPPLPTARHGRKLTHHPPARIDDPLASR